MNARRPTRRRPLAVVGIVLLCGLSAGCKKETEGPAAGAAAAKPAPPLEGEAAGVSRPRLAIEPAPAAPAAAPDAAPAGAAADVQAAPAAPAAPAGGSDRYDAALRGLRDTAKACSPVEPGRMVFCAAWKTHYEGLKPTVAGADPRHPESLAPLRELLRAAAALVDAADPAEREAARMLLKRGFERLRTAPAAEIDPFRAVLAERFRRESDARERLDLLRTLSYAPSALGGALFLDALGRDPDVEVRVAAASSLDACDRKLCPVTAEQVRAAYGAEREPRVKVALLRLAGSLQLPEIVDWCKDQVVAGALRLGCREALKRLQTEPAFELLYGWIAARKDDPESFKPGDYSFRDEFAYLLPFADLPFAKERYYALIDTVLAQKQRSGYAIGIIARQLAWLKDLPRARQIAQKHLKAYGKLWKNAAEKDRQFVIEELRRTAENLDGKGGVYIDRPLRVNP